MEYKVVSGENVYYRNCLKCAEKMFERLKKIRNEVKILKGNEVIKEWHLMK